jgi:hypothetical protein
MVGQVEPKAFCEKWMSGDGVRAPGERGWRTDAVAFLAGSLQISSRTVDNWGADFSSCPEAMKAHLFTIDRRLDLERSIVQVKALLSEAQALLGGVNVDSADDSATLDP